MTIDDRMGESWEEGQDLSEDLDLNDFDFDFDDDFEEETQEEIDEEAARHEGDFTAPPPSFQEPPSGDAD